MNLPLFVHVLSSLVLIGAVTLAATWLVAAWRSGDRTKIGLGFRTLLWAVIPAWIAMRLSSQWILDKEGLEDADLAWVDIGFIAAEPTFLLLAIATLIAGLRVRSGAVGPTIGTRLATAFVSIALIAYLVALWAMTTKPV